MKLLKLIDCAIEQGASDIHFSVGHAPLMRIDGDLTPILSKKTLKPEEVGICVQHMIPDHLKSAQNHINELDFAFKLSAHTRLRVNVFKQMNGLSLALRVLPAHIPNLTDLGSFQQLSAFCKLSKGLVLITGATGSGKSTTLAAMINQINEHQKRHIITLEDPIEYVFKSNQALIQQREMRLHSNSFNDGLRAALRQDPDILFIGELRDLDTIRLALTASETGHLVLSTLHTASAAQTINRIVDVFPGTEKALICTLLAESLQAVISQTLVKKKKGGRIAAMEILIANQAVRHLIRENKTSQLVSVMQTGQQEGMCTMERSLEHLLTQGVIACPLTQSNRLPKNNEFS